MSLTTFLILALADWRISYLLMNEDGPWNFIARIRFLLGVRYDELSHPYGTNVISDALVCWYCAPFWIGVLIVVFYWLAPGLAPVVLLPFSLGTVVLILNRFF